MQRTYANVRKGTATSTNVRRATDTDYATNVMTLTYDNEADALAIHVTDGIVDRTVEIEPGTLVDVDAAGHVLVIEVIQPGRRWSLEDVLDRFELSEADEAVLRGIRGGDDAVSMTELAPLAVA